MKSNPPRRSLQVRVVDSQALPLPPRIQHAEMRENENGNRIRSSPNRPTEPGRAPFLRVVAPDSVASLQSVGRDFSRYPSRQPSNNTLLGVTTPPKARPVKVPIVIDDSTSGVDGEDPERGFSPYIQRRGGPVQYPTIDEKEDDDNLHNPQPGDDARPRLRDCHEHFNLRAFFAVMFIGMFVAGLFTLFIVWPIVTYARLGGEKTSVVIPDRLSNLTFPILSSIRTSLVDPDTPIRYRTRKSVLGTETLKLVFSDEFNKDGRTFYPGDDQFWTAANIWYGATEDLEWYDPKAITTKDGTLQIMLKATDPATNHNLTYMSGMLQSWNQLCFKGGIMEVSASLPGPAGVPGLWPGIWSLGNLARPGYTASSDGTWPYAYNDCDAGITPNQSSADGLSMLPGQRLPRCTCQGEDHPSAGVGRGAPEIDALEGSASYEQRVGVVTQSSQIVGYI